MTNHRSKIELVSQINLLLYNSEKGDVFETARKEILNFVKTRAGGDIPKEAFEGSAFSTDDIGPRRIEAISIDDPQIWALRFDDEDRKVAARSWIIETALARQEDEKRVIFGTRLQCITRGEDVKYNRSIPSFVRNVIKACNSRLDGHPLKMTPWFVNTKEDVRLLIDLLCSETRKADVIVLSLPENSIDPSQSIISAERLVRELAGAVHVVVISGPASFHLSDHLGREFSVYQQAVRTYKPSVDPDRGDPFAHPLGLADRIRIRNGGPESYRRFLVSNALRRTVHESESEQILPSFAKIKRIAAEERRQKAKQAGSKDDELLVLADNEIDQLKNEIANQKQEHDEILESIDIERKSIEAENQRLKSLFHHSQRRISALEKAESGKHDILIPTDLSGLKEWADEHLSGSVELHSRALRGAKNSEYEDVSLIYNSLLLLRDYYVPMHQRGIPKNDFLQKCQELNIDEQPTFAGNRANEQGDTYYIKFGNQRRLLDRHLKKGTSREPRYCFRLYFLWDEDTNQVVVGWLPSHLKTRIS